MTNSNLYIDVHVLQTVPSSNINRDDTGSPKTALYGGVTRSRVSSQSWKRAMRDGFENDDYSVGVRTKKVLNMLSDALVDKMPDLSAEDSVEQATEILKTAGIKINKDGETGALLLISRGQIEKIAEYALNNEELDKKELKAVINGNQSLDLALFGRMVADNPELNVEGSAQVAHAISTHEIQPEFDYFTALDDLAPKDNAGASMLGSIEFNSATLYRYANLNVKELIHNIGSETAIEGVQAFIKEFALTMPTGKQKTFANKTLPQYVMVTLRQDTPVNLVSAFESAIHSNDGYVKDSISQLEHEYNKAGKIVENPLFNIVLSQEGTESETPADNLSDLLNKVSAAVEEVVSDEDFNA
ncbi:type I-E CRISPR-associated protein Cas7/Cse4/CasC [Secundilactobacillus kimchicus]|uniref:type I-E CRISPR-associated protein Cas7/Cse4/CasC n=1 Tax=Secundilactobacillus kimchicus TaxID=528209 RepID=UPI0024A96D07|nr:type I-E CRISPR-associated protein Cas7/Cse4/CasC [Secundilactobacillus kimchicus]